MAKVTLRRFNVTAAILALGVFLFWSFIKSPMWFLNWQATVFPALFLVMLWGAGAWWLWKREHRAYPEKAKRGGVSSGDMYTLIDRMIDNLDADELDYLRQRMDEAESRMADEDWGESLDERETRRRMRR